MAVRDLSGAKCVITGAASGIGRATALLAARKGALLFLTDVQDAALAETVHEIREAGGQVALHEAFDIADHQAVAAFAARIHQQHGSVDVVMNVAGISIWGAVENLRHEDWKKLIDINLMGPIHVIESFVPEMVRAGRGGHLVNVSSAAGLFGLPWHAAYSASKFGLRGISEVLRFDLARHHIDVSLVCPGGVDTPLVNTLQVVGVDRTLPALQELAASFQKHAVTPERAAAAIVRGVEKRQYMIYTSNDIRFAHWLQRKLSLPYELIMRRLNDRLYRAYERAGQEALARRAAPTREPEVKLSHLAEKAEP